MIGGNGQAPVVSEGVGGDLRQQRRDDRDTLAAWQARMREGKQSVTAWLDDQPDSDEHPGYARTLLQLRHSTDDRVRLGALKIEGELREWFGAAAAKPSQTVNVDARQQVALQIPESWLKDPRLRDAALTLTERVIGGEKTNGQE